MIRWNQHSRKGVKPTALQRQLEVAHGDDLTLVRRVLNKDKDAFDEFFIEYFSRLHRFCMLRVSDAALAEDLVQETMIRAIKGFASYRGEASLFTWLCQILRNQISDWNRSNGNKLQLQDSLDDRPEIRAAMESVQSRIAGDEREMLANQQVVHLVLDYLPARYGAVLELKYIEGHSVEEIAHKMSASTASVQSLLARARSAFRSTYHDLTQELGVST